MLECGVLGVQDAAPPLMPLYAGCATPLHWAACFNHPCGSSMVMTRKVSVSRVRVGYSGAQLVDSVSPSSSSILNS